MPNFSDTPRILFVTPEVIFTPNDNVKNSYYLNPQAGRVAHLLSGLIRELFEQGFDVHVAQPDYRSVFASLSQKKQYTTDEEMPLDRVHFTEDRIFFYSGKKVRFITRIVLSHLIFSSHKNITVS